MTGHAQTGQRKNESVSVAEEVSQGGIEEDEENRLRCLSIVVCLLGCL